MCVKIKWTFKRHKVNLIKPFIKQKERASELNTNKNQDSF